MFTLPKNLQRQLLGAVGGVVIALLVYWLYSAFSTPVQAFLGFDQGVRFTEADREAKRTEIVEKVREIMSAGAVRHSDDR